MGLSLHFKRKVLIDTICKIDAACSLLILTLRHGHQELHFNVQPKLFLTFKTNENSVRTSFYKVSNQDFLFPHAPNHRHLYFLSFSLPRGHRANHSTGSLFLIQRSTLLPSAQEHTCTRGALSVQLEQRTR